ncbi:MAG TPA: rhomboid family intramembrane serine protease [Blastocatellia bacterium]|nr:rhomboid family intramembrane serine protease [Blastocatellia bacterium]
MEQAAIQQKLRVCPSCGKLIPTDTTQCIYCGLRFEEEIAAQREVAETRRFVGALFMRGSPFTFLFFGINAGLFVLMWLAGGMGAMQADESVLLGFGAKQNELIRDQHEYWRLVTCIFLHIGFLHIFFNNYALWIIGQEIERLYGSARFVVLYLATGIAASIASYLFSPTHPSAGASGALFGLFGVLGVFAFRYRKEIPDSISRAIKRRVLPLIVINLMLGFSTSIVDNSAHVGGLVAGAVLCLVVPYKRPHEESTPVVWRTLQGISLSIIALSFVMAFRSYDGPPLRLSNLAARDSNRTPRTPAGKYVTEMATADDAMTSARRTFYALVAMQNVEMSASPALAAVRQGLRSIEQTPRMDEPAEAFRRQLFDLLARQEEIIELHDASPSKNWKKELADQRELASRHSQFEEEFVPWLEEYAKKHGVPITGAPDNQ